MSSINCLAIVRYDDHDNGTLKEKLFKMSVPAGTPVRVLVNRVMAERVYPMGEHNFGKCYICTNVRTYDDEFDALVSISTEQALVGGERYHVELAIDNDVCPCHG